MPTYNSEVRYILHRVATPFSIAVFMQLKEPDCNFTCIGMCTQLFQFNEYNNNPKRNVDHTINVFDFEFNGLDTRCIKNLLSKCNSIPVFNKMMLID